MRTFPALSHSFISTRFHLFCSLWCRQNFGYKVDDMHTECYKERDAEHPLCAHCLGILKITDVVAHFISPGGHEGKADVVNPGDKDGEAIYIVYVSDCFSPPLFAVEASGDSDAIEEFVSNDRSAHMVAIDPSDYGDYASSCSRGDMIGGKDIDEDGWLDLNGKFYKEDPRLSEPSFGPSGEIYDGDNIGMWAPEQIKKVRYFGIYEDIPLPTKGIRPTNFSAWVEHVQNR